MSSSNLNLQINPGTTKQSIGIRYYLKNKILKLENECVGSYHFPI